MEKREDPCRENIHTDFSDTVSCPSLSRVEDARALPGGEFYRASK